MTYAPLTTTAIILRRTNYGETDRIMTLLTPDYGKIQVIAKGVRKEKSRLAGGIELFSVSEVSFVRGKSDIATLVSTQLERHFDVITDTYDRTMLAYDLLKWIDLITEASCEAVYFETLKRALIYLNEPRIMPGIVQAWYLSELLAITGHEINAFEDTGGALLTADVRYMFDREAGRFVSHPESGTYTAEHIKVLRLLRIWTPERLVTIAGIETLIGEVCTILETAGAFYLRIKQ